MIALKKKYYLKIYDKRKSTLVTTINEFYFGSYSWRAYGGLGELVVELTTLPTGVDSSIAFAINNYCDIYVLDKEAPSGKRIYSGYIEGSSIDINNKTYRYKLELVGHFNKFASTPCYRRTWEGVNLGGGGFIYLRNTGGVATLRTSANRGLAGINGDSAAAAPVGECVKRVVELYRANSLNPVIVNQRDKKELYDTDLINNLSLKAYWRFEEDLLDSSGNGHSLSQFGGSGSYSYTLDFSEVNPSDYTLPMVGYKGRSARIDLYDGGMVFAGGLSAVNHSDFRPTGQFTIGGAFRVNQVDSNISGNQMLFMSGNTSGGTDKGIFLRVLTTGKVRFTVDSTSMLNSVRRIDDGSWHEIVVKRTTTAYELWIDGEIENTTISATNPTYHATNYVMVGSKLVDPGFSPTEVFDGFFDEIFVFNGYAVTEAEIKDLWGEDTIEAADNNVTYTFNSWTNKQVLDKLMEYIPSTYLYYVNRDNEFVFKQKSNKLGLPFSYYERDILSKPTYWSFDKNTIKNDQYAYPDEMSVSEPVTSNKVINLTNALFVEGKIKEAVQLNGTSSYGSWVHTNDVYDVSRDGQFGSAGITFKVDNPYRSTNQGLFQFYHESGGDSYGMRVYINSSGKLVITIGGGSFGGIPNTTLDPVLKPNKWYNLVVVLSEIQYSAQTGTFKIYLNGQLIYNSVANIGNGSNGTYKRIGSLDHNGSSNSSFFGGVIDDFYITTDRLEQADVWYLFYDSVAKHQFKFEKHLKKINWHESSKGLVNNYLLSGDGSLSNNYIANSNNPKRRSLIKYDDRWSIRSDQRMSDSGTSDSRGNSFVLSNQEPIKYITGVEIIDSNYDENGYDIESIEIGDTVSIANIPNIRGNYIADQVMIVVGITYNKSYATLELSTIDELLANEIARIKDRESIIAGENNYHLFENVYVK